MKPYNWINKYCRVLESKGNNTCWSKKSKRQESKNIITEGIQEDFELTEDAWEDFCNEEGI